MTDAFSKIDIEIIKGLPNTTPFAGLFQVGKMCDALKLPEIINTCLNVRRNKGYSDAEHVLSLVFMQLAGGEAVEHLGSFAERFKLEFSSLNIPSPTAVRDFLNEFHNAEEDSKRVQGHVFIPKEKDSLAGFQDIHAQLLQKAYTLNPLENITLDQDATFINSQAAGALYNYHRERSFEALNTYCPEYDLVVRTQFRDGNVNPGWGQLEQLQKALENLPSGVKKVSLRSDSAGYQELLLKYCAAGENERLGIIDFAISCPMYAALRNTARALPENCWNPLMKEKIIRGVKGLQYTGQDWAEVSFVPSWLVSDKNDFELRYLVIRERIDSKDTGALHEAMEARQGIIEEVIADAEAENPNLKKLHMEEMSGQIYKMFAVVTNKMEIEGSELIFWQRRRCGKSEELHYILKEELGGGNLSRKRYGANAAWWNITVLALSIHSLFKRYFLPKELQTIRVKGLRYLYYTSVGQLVKHARKFVLKIHAVFSKWFEYVNQRLKVVSDTLH